MVEKQKAALFMIALLLIGLDVEAAVVASVDRPGVELNESFTLEIVVDTETDLAPDIAALEKDFYVGQGSQRSNTTIINGQISRSQTWKYVLTPRRAGQLSIGPISVGNERSEALVVAVSEPSHAPPGEADVFITSELDVNETYVQAQVLYRIKIYRAVATRQHALRDPVITGVESLVELAGDDRRYEAIIDGKAYSVDERVLALYPQQSGEIQISPARFEARVLRDGRITGRKVYESDPQTITVRPMPAPPEDYPDAVWLPARSLELSEDWSKDPRELVVGQPITRHVTISALGQLETQIPALEPPVTDDVNIYPDKPDLSRRIEVGGIRGVRKDQYAMIGATPGVVRLPALEVPWWNTEAGAWQVARLPERAINMLSSGEPARVAEVTAAAPEPIRDAEPASVIVYSNFWRHISEVLAAVWLLTVLVWWWSARPDRKPRAPEAVPPHKQQAKYLKAARKAALADDAAGVRSAMLEWGRSQWPDDAPRSIGSLASRVSSPLADELGKLSSVSYGPADSAWSGEAMARALRSFAVLPDDDNAKAGDLLPPLMPPTA